MMDDFVFNGPQNPEVFRISPVGNPLLLTPLLAVKKHSALVSIFSADIKFLAARVYWEIEVGSVRTLVDCKEMWHRRVLIVVVGRKVGLRQTSPFKAINFVTIQS